jgi:hypothetical protein
MTLLNDKRAAEAARALAKLEANPRVRDIRIIVQAEACPACQAVEGTYQKGEVPALPVEGCSCLNGCDCYYQPMLSEIYP